MLLFQVKSIPSPLRFECGEETVFFHEDSGSTHLVNALGSQILTELMQTPLSADELYNRLSASSPIDRNAMELFLDFGVKQGLIEQACSKP